MLISNLLKQCHQQYWIRSFICRMYVYSLHRYGQHRYYATNVIIARPRPRRYKGSNSTNSCGAMTMTSQLSGKNHDFRLQYIPMLSTQYIIHSNDDDERPMTEKEANYLKERLNEKSMVFMSKIDRLHLIAQVDTLIHVCKNQRWMSLYAAHKLNFLNLKYRYSIAEIQWTRTVLDT